MNDEFKTAFIRLSNDSRLTVWHISVYMAIFFKWRENAYINPILVTRREVMRLAHIGSIATYHKCVKELEEFGYMKYSPSYNPLVGSQINVLTNPSS
jgi:hypothetical protein